MSWSLGLNGCYNVSSLLRVWQYLVHKRFYDSLSIKWHTLNPTPLPSPRLMMLVGTITLLQEEQSICNQHWVSKKSKLLLVHLHEETKFTWILTKSKPGLSTFRIIGALRSNQFYNLSDQSIKIEIRNYEVCSKFPEYLMTLSMQTLII